MNTENLSASLDSAFDNAEVVEETVEEVAPEVTPEPVEPVEEYTPLDAPEFFAKDHKELFAKMQEDESSRAYAKAWHDQYTSGQEFINGKLQEVQSSKQDLQTFKDYQQAISPLNETWASRGMTPAQGLVQLAHYGQMLNSNPAQLIQEIATSGRVDLNKLVEEQPYVDPQVAQLQQQMQNMQMQNQQQQQYQQHQQQLKSNETVNKTITEFQSATDENGNSKHPYFAQVENIMAELITMPNNGIDDINSAYERAVQYNPEIQAEIQAQAKKQEAESRNVEAIKATTASIKTQSTNQDAPVKKIGWEEQMEIDLKAAEAS
jgi:hypothetical protein